MTTFTGVLSLNKYSEVKAQTEFFMF